MKADALASWRWMRLSLQRRLLLILWGTILLVLTGQIAVSISGDVAALDQTISSQGTILAQAVAAQCADLINSPDPERFSSVLERTRGRVDLVELALLSRTGVVVAHSDPTRVGEHMKRPPGVFSGGTLEVLRGILEGHTEHLASAPVSHGRMVEGTVYLRFRSPELRSRASRLVGSAVAAGAFWMLLGAVLGTIYVRKITGPLAQLTDAANALREDRLDDVKLQTTERGDEVGRLQSTFAGLVSSLRAERDKNARLVGELQDLNLSLQQRVDDVTASLREAKAYLESVLQCIQEGIITCDLEGRVVQANPGAFHQLGNLGKPVRGQRLDEILPHAEILLEAAREAMHHGAQQREWVHRAAAEALPVGQTPTTLVFRFYPLHGGDGVVLGTVVIVQDVTRHRVVEAQLRRHDRLISLGTIAAGLAHELGNYLHTINGYSSLVLRSLDPQAPQVPDVQSIRNDCARAMALLERFRQFARPQEVHYHDEDLDLLLREAVTMAGYQIRHARVQVVDELHGSLPKARCDSQLIKQVLVNILLNAVDAMEKAADKRLTLRSRPLDDGRVELQITDSGEGIDPAHLENIFDPFFTTKAAKGTGLGLSIAHQIVVLQHHGSITAHSRKGEGATFTVTLPLHGPGSHAT